MSKVIKRESGRGQTGLRVPVSPRHRALSLVLQPCSCGHTSQQLLLLGGGGGGRWSELSVHWLPKGQMRHKNSSSHVSLKWSVGVEDALKIHILTMAGQVLGGLSHL